MKKIQFVEDFKKFIAKGNVVDMAVGVIIGASFGKIVTGLVNDILNPFLGIFIKSGNLDSFKTVITAAKDAVLDAEGNVVTPAVAENAILWGTWLQTIIDFLITSFCIFVLLRVLMKAKDHLETRKKAEEAAEAKKQAELAAIEQAAHAAEAEKLAARQKQLEESQLHQEALLTEILQTLQKK